MLLAFLGSAMTCVLRSVAAPFIAHTLREVMQMSRDTSKAEAGLRALAERNNTARQRAVSGLIRMTGSARAIRANDERNKERGTNG